MVIESVKAIPGLLSVRQAAKRLGFTKYGIMKAIQRGELPASHIDGFYVIAEGAVDDYIREWGSKEDGRRKRIRKRKR
jgi:excisionase family DNA binding protein